jgi:hypothetical protein
VNGFEGFLVVGGDGDAGARVQRKISMRVIPRGEARLSLG